MGDVAGLQASINNINGWLIIASLYEEKKVHYDSLLTLEESSASAMCQLEQAASPHQLGFTSDVLLDV